MVYLIHFSGRYAGKVQHYVGWAKDAYTFGRRIEHHRRGSGSRLMRAVSFSGMGWDVVRTWEGGSRALERYLKRQKNTRRYCPVCMAELGEEAWNAEGKGE